MIFIDLGFACIFDITSWLYFSILITENIDEFLQLFHHNIFQVKCSRLNIFMLHNILRPSFWSRTVRPCAKLTKYYFRCWRKCNKWQQILVNLDLNTLHKFQNNNWMSTQQSLSHPGSKKPNYQSTHPKFSRKIWNFRRYRHLFRSFSCQNTLFNLFCFI